LRSEFAYRYRYVLGIFVGREWIAEAVVRVTVTREV
jgi:hypothetical protein